LTSYKNPFQNLSFFSLLLGSLSLQQVEVYTAMFQEEGERTSANTHGGHQYRQKHPFLDSNVPEPDLKYIHFEVDCQRCGEEKKGESFRHEIDPAVNQRHVKLFNLQRIERMEVLLILLFDERERES